MIILNIIGVCYTFRVKPGLKGGTLIGINGSYHSITDASFQTMDSITQTKTCAVAMNVLQTQILMVLQKCLSMIRKFPNDQNHCPATPKCYETEVLNNSCVYDLKLLRWYWGNHTIGPIRMKQSHKKLVNVSQKLIIQLQQKKVPYKRVHSHWDIL